MVQEPPGGITGELEAQGFAPLPGSKKNSPPDILIELTLSAVSPELLMVRICSREVLPRLTTLKLFTGSGETAIVDTENAVVAASRVRDIQDKRTKTVLRPLC
jgi:hypothetical protein